MVPSLPLLPVSLKGKLKRPARLAIKYGTAETFQKAAAFYNQLLGESTAQVPGGVSLPVGQSKRDIELLLLEPSASGQSANTAVVYWEVGAPKGQEREMLRTTHQAIASLPGYRSVVAPTEEGGGPTSQKEAPAVSLIQDDSGNQFGLIVNPNYPRFTDRAWPLPTKLLLLLGVFGAGLLGPGLFRKLFK